MEPHFNRGDAFHLVSRVVAINQQRDRPERHRDVEINQQLRLSGAQPMLAEKRYIPILVVRPLAPIPFDVENLTPPTSRG